MQKYKNIPLCVDLDGTLVRTNTLLEAAITAIQKKPSVIFEMLQAALAGKIALKHVIGIHAPHNASLLPYNKEFLAWLIGQHAQGRTLILATASDKAIADAVALKLGIFADVIASTPEHPVSANSKYSVLCKKFGIKGFSYAGNSHADLAVWNCAYSAVLVDTDPNVTKKAKKMVAVEAEFLGYHTPTFRVVLKTIRIHQWVKNLLLLIAIIAAHRIFEPAILLTSIVGFLSFSLLASSVYICNDIFDLASDRTHATKRFRPIAAGEIRVSHAIYIGISIAAVSIALAVLFLPRIFIGILAVYFFITSMYSLRLKRMPYVDVGILAGLYVLRIIAGGKATSIPVSNWLLLFAGCFFISLATIKRVTELTRLDHMDTKAIGRGYKKTDKQLLKIIGTTSAIFSCIVLVFYTKSIGVTKLYTSPNTLVLIVPILGIWMARMWKHAIAGSLPEDPVLFAIKDYVSYGAIIAISGIVFLAS